MFFETAKLSWLLINPGNLLLLLLLAGALLLWTRWRRAGRWLVTATALAGLAVATLPAGRMFITFLENRFPPGAPMPARVDGIVVLAGGLDRFVAGARKRLPDDGDTQRITEFTLLAQRYPGARLVFTGGAPDLFRVGPNEADVTADFLRILRLDPARVTFERDSRNTHENAVASYGLVKPKPDETWILVTSARHMPRAVGCFRKAGWKVFPYPVGFSTAGDEPFELTFNLVAGLGQLGYALYEFTGLVAYWATGRTDALFPGPAP